MLKRQNDTNFTISVSSPKGKISFHEFNTKKKYFILRIQAQKAARSFEPKKQFFNLIVSSSKMQDLILQIQAQKISNISVQSFKPK